jgi:hypothetical protein
MWRASGAWVGLRLRSEPCDCSGEDAGLKPALRETTPATDCERCESEHSPLRETKGKDAGDGGLRELVPGYVEGDG